MGGIGCFCFRFFVVVFFYLRKATWVSILSSRGPHFPLTPMISIYYLLSHLVDEGHIIPNGIMGTCYSLFDRSDVYLGASCIAEMTAGDGILPNR